MNVYPAQLTLADDRDTLVIRPVPLQGTPPILCKTWDLGAPDSRESTAPRAGADGMVDRAAYTGARTVTFELAVVGDATATAYNYADRLAAFTHPSRRPKLYISRGNPEATGEVWELLLRGNPFSITYGRRSAALLEMQLTFTAPVGLLEGPWRGRETVAAEELAYTAINLVPNPSFEVDTANWVASGGTLARSTAQAWRGTASGLFSATASGSAAYAATPDTVMAATPGLTYTLQGQIRMSTVNSRNVFARIYFLDSGGAVLTSMSGTSIPHDQTAWRRNWVTGTAPANTAYTSGYFMGGTNVVSGDAWHLDGVMLEQSDLIRPYFDGATTGASWSGTANNSASRYPFYPAQYGVVAGQPLPWRLGNIEASQPWLDLTIGGHAPVHPVLYIYGPATDPSVETDDGEIFAFAGLSLAAGQFVAIDMGEGTVRLDGAYDASVYHLVDFTQSTFWRWQPGPKTVRYETQTGRLVVQWRERRLHI